MNLQQIKGVWPVMITPFNHSGEINYRALDELVDWYAQKGVTGLFAVCQSSEMFYLSSTERVELARHIKKRSSLPVIASGHVSDSPTAQVEELKAMADTGVDAVVMITNRQAQEGESPKVWIEGMDKLLSQLPDNVPLGLYECPHPYKRVLSDEELEFCAATGRFRFLKDTCCHLPTIQQRLHILKNTSLALFNANSATLLESLRAGAEGFSGVMANYHPELYVWLCSNWHTSPDKAERLQAGLTFASMIEKQCYPTSAKLYLAAQGLSIGERCRVKSAAAMTSSYRDEVKQLETLTEMLRELTR